MIHAAAAGALAMLNVLLCTAYVLVTDHPPTIWSPTIMYLCGLLTAFHIFMAWRSRQ